MAQVSCLLAQPEDLIDDFEMVTTENDCGDGDRAAENGQCDPNFLRADGQKINSKIDMEPEWRDGKVEEIKELLEKNKSFVDKMAEVRIKGDPIKLNDNMNLEVSSVGWNSIKDFKILITTIPLKIRLPEISAIFSQWGRCFIVDNGRDSVHQWVLLSYFRQDDQVRAILNGNQLNVHGHLLKVKEVNWTRKLSWTISPWTSGDGSGGGGVKKNGGQVAIGDAEDEVEFKDDVVGQLGWGWTLLLFVLCLVPWGRPLLLIFISFGIFCRLHRNLNGALSRKSKKSDQQDKKF